MVTKQGDSKGEGAKNPLKASNGDSVFHEVGHETGGDGDWMPVILKPGTRHRRKQLPKPNRK